MQSKKTIQICQNKIGFLISMQCFVIISEFINLFAFNNHKYSNFLHLALWVLNYLIINSILFKTKNNKLKVPSKLNEPNYFIDCKKITPT